MNERIAIQKLKLRLYSIIFPIKSFPKNYYPHSFAQLVPVQKVSSLLSLLAKLPVPTQILGQFPTSNFCQNLISALVNLPTAEKVSSLRSLLAHVTHFSRRIFKIKNFPKVSSPHQFAQLVPVEKVSSPGLSWVMSPAGEAGNYQCEETPDSNQGPKINPSDKKRRTAWGP